MKLKLKIKHKRQNKLN